MQVDTSIYPAAQQRDGWQLRRKAFRIAALCAACVLLGLNLLLGGSAWSIIVLASANVIATAMKEGLFQKARWRRAWLDTVYAINILLLCIDWATGGGGWAHRYVVPSILAGAAAAQAALFAAGWRSGRADMTETVVLAVISMLHIVLAAPKAALPTAATQAAMTALLVIVLALCCREKLFSEWKKRWRA